jgi:hypothetical protein
MGTFFDKIQENKNNYSQRLAQYGIDRNPNFQDYPEFVEALKSELSGTPQGQGAISEFTETELIELFKQSNVRTQLEMNIGKSETDKIYEAVERTDVIVIRRVKVGEKTKPSDIGVWVVEKKIRKSSYINTRTGKRVPAHSTSYNRWNTPQTNFLKQKRTLLKQKKTTINQIVFDYNKKFKDNPREIKSVQSKLYRI